MWGFSLNSLGSACVPEVDSERTCVGNSYGRMRGGEGRRAQASNLGLAGPRLDAPAPVPLPGHVWIIPFSLSGSKAGAMIWSIALGLKPGACQPSGLKNHILCGSPHFPGLTSCLQGVLGRTPKTPPKTVLSPNGWIWPQRRASVLGLNE